MKKLLSVTLIILFLFASKETNVKAADTINYHIYGNVNEYNQQTGTVAVTYYSESIEEAIKNGDLHYIDFFEIEYNGIIDFDFNTEKILRAHKVIVVYGTNICVNNVAGITSDKVVELQIGNAEDEEKSVFTAFNLPQEYPAITGDDTKEQAMQRKAELPDEVTVIKPIKPLEKKAFYVATNGDDNNDGSIDAPFKTINQGLKALRNWQKPGEIVIRSGRYTIDEALEIDKRIYGTELSPSFIRGYEGENVVITKGIQLKTEDFQPVADIGIRNRINNVNAREKVLQYDLKNIGMNSLNSSAVRDTMLLMNGLELKKSRWPNFEEIRMGEIISGGKYTDFSATVTQNPSEVKYYSYYDEPLTWQNAGNIFFCGAYYRNWDLYTNVLKEIDSEAGTITTSGCSGYEQAESSDTVTHYYVNVFEEIDLPGEWCIDKNSCILYIYPPDDFKNAEIVIFDGSDRSSVLEINEVNNIVIDNLTINSVYDGIGVSESENVIIQNCKIHDALNTGVKIIKSNHCGVINSTFIDINNRGIDISGVLSETEGMNSERMALLEPNRNFVQNCVFDNVNDSGIYLSYGMGNVVSHNVITNSHRNGIRIGGEVETIVEYNEISGGQSSGVGDAGLIYIGGLPMLRGCHIRYNYIHDPLIASTGIYFDDMSADSLAYGNVIVNCCRGVFTHGGRDLAVFNNVIMSKQESNSDEKKESMPIGDGTTYWYSDGKCEQLLKKMFFDENSQISKFMQSDLYNNELWKLRFPKLFEFLSDVSDYKVEYLSLGDLYVRGDAENVARAPLGLYYGNNLIIGNNDVTVSNVARPTTTGLNTNYRFDKGTDPGFADAENDDFSISDYTAIHKVIPEFFYIPFDKAGLVNAQMPEVSKATVLSSFQSMRYAEDNQIVIKWAPAQGADLYNVCVSQYEDFSEAVYDINTSDTSIIIPEASLLGTELYVRIRAASSSNAYRGSTSEVKIFIDFDDVVITDYKISAPGNIQITLENKSNGKATFSLFCKSDDNNDIRGVRNITLESAQSSNIPVEINTDSGVYAYLWKDGLVPVGNFYYFD